MPALHLFKHLGDVSYSTYLVHPAALCIVIHLMGQPQSLYGQILAIGVYTGMTLVPSYLSHRWIKTGPLTQVLKGRLPAEPDRIAVAQGYSQ